MLNAYAEWNKRVYAAKKKYAHAAAVIAATVAVTVVAAAVAAVAVVAVVAAAAAAVKVVKEKKVCKGLEFFGGPATFKS